MNLAVIAVVLVGLVSVLGFLYHRLVVAPHLGPRWRWAGRIFLVALVVGIVSGFVYSRPKNPAFWRPVTSFLASLTAYGFYLVLLLALVALSSLIWRLVERRGATAAQHPAPAAPPGARAMPRLQRRTAQPIDRTAAVEAGPGTRLRWVRRATAAALALAAVITGSGAISASYPRTVDVTIVSGDLPTEFDGLRVALITDLHLGPDAGKSFVRRVVDQTNALHPDLIVLGGDYADGSVAALGDEMTPLGDLRAPYGVVVTSGNHEYYSGVADWLAYLRGLGLTVLDNDAVVLVRGSASIDVIGVNDATGTVPYQEDLPQALRQLTKKYGVPADATGRFRLLVAHQPRQVFTRDNLAARVGVDLQLAGHTHGGQIWPFTYAVALTQPAVEGLHTIAGVQVYTSRGVGTTGPPVRVGEPPELTLLTLRRG